MILSSSDQGVQTQHMRDASPVTSLDALPLVLTVNDLLRVYRIGYSTLRKQLAARTFRPEPFAVNPYRWLRSDVARHLERQASASPVRSARGRKKKRVAESAPLTSRATR